MFDSLKKLKSAASEIVEHKLSSTQKKIIGFNKCLLLLHMGKPAEAREMVQQLQQQFAGDEGFTLINASILIKVRPLKLVATDVHNRKRRPKKQQHYCSNITAPTLSSYAQD